MHLTYLGHSCFKLKGKRGTIVTDPYFDDVGFSLPTVSADIVTVSHGHKDHSAHGLVSGTARRKNPFIIDQPGEYEVGGLSVFGVKTYHDDQEGAERGSNIVFTMLVDDLRVCHLGDLGHELTPEQIEAIGHIDVLLCPVGGESTVGPEQAVKVIRSIEPSIVVPMHYQTDRHNKEIFGNKARIEDFIKVYGAEVTPVDKLDLAKSRMPEETELVVLTEQLL